MAYFMETSFRAEWSTSNAALSLKDSLQKQTQQACNDVLDAFYWQNIQHFPSGYGVLPLKIYGSYAEHLNASEFNAQFRSVETVSASDFRERVKAYFRWK